jgi:hypothetical protein
MTKISEDSSDFLDICDLYYEGKINIWEAAGLIENIMPIGEEAIIDMLEGLDRNNVVPFKAS